MPVRLLFIVLPSWDMPALLSSIDDSLKRNTSYYTVVKSREAYFNLDEKERYSFDVIAPWGLPGFAKELIVDQMEKSKSFKWLHSLSVGCDEYCSVQNFRESSIPCTNARGAFSDVLAEYVLMGMLYHAKHVEQFQSRKQRGLWENQPMELMSTKTLTVVGYGDIGSACARMAKRAFGMKVIGVNKFPSMVSKEMGQWADEIVGLEEYERALGQADFVLGALPKMVSTDNFFNASNCFNKMKQTAIFMNIGRGTTVDEDDLAEALFSKRIAGGVLDVFKKEPLVNTSKLWSAPNLFITPHCADQDSGWLFRSMKILGDNLDKWSANKSLHNLIDKEHTFKGTTAAKL